MSTTEQATTDREMLELAAKAAGYDVVFWSDKCAFKVFPHKPWNPRDDDGDSFRLAMKLRLDLLNHHTTMQARLPGAGILGSSTVENSDSEAAMRRAIWYCAVEIGRAMP